MMKRIGRRGGFMIGPLAGLVGATIAIHAITERDFWLFCVGSFLIGMLNGVGHYYRFAAADISGSGYRSRAISWVLAGGVVAAFAGPNLAAFNRDLIVGFPFAGSYASLLILYSLLIILAALLRIPPPTEAERRGAQRPLSEIARQPVFFVPVIGALIAYGVMNLVMTSTPLAMAGCGHSFGDTAFVIEWHVLAMFLPSFFTGHLIVRFGVLRIMGVGVVLLFGSVAANLSGVTVTHFVVGLTLLGLGWNFLFVGGTTLVTESYSPAEKAKTQGLNDLMIFGTVALTAAVSGVVHETAGWEMLNLLVLPFLLAALVLILWLSRARKRQSMINA
jgi:predicted MFS family arabinose efflux permease